MHWIASTLLSSVGHCDDVLSNIDTFIVTRKKSSTKNKQIQFLFRLRQNSHSHLTSHSTQSLFYFFLKFDSGRDRALLFFFRKKIGILVFLFFYRWRNSDDEIQTPVTTTRLINTGTTSSSLSLFSLFSFSLFSLSFFLSSSTREKKIRKKIYGMYTSKKISHLNHTRPQKNDES